MTTPIHAPGKVDSAALTKLARPAVQRKCDCGAAAKSGEKCPECEETAKKGVVQRSAAGRESAGEVPSIVNEVLQSPGQPLDRATREFFEPRFGADFSSVRVHTDGKAAESARAVSAHAYTVGNDIVFNQGEYAPDTTDGRTLLAHELTHTVQQGGLQRSATGPTHIAGNDAAEREAADTARAVLSGSAQHVNNQSPQGTLQRDACGDFIEANTAKKAEVNGTMVHNEILKDFMGKPGAIKPFQIPTGSYDPYRTEGYGSDKTSPVIKPQVIGSKGRREQGFGTPDLKIFAWTDSNEIEIAEIKPAVVGARTEGEQQLRNYIDKAMSDEVKDWRDEKSEELKIIIKGFKEMDPARYPARSIGVGGTLVQLFWCGKGLLLYAVAAGPVEKKKADDVATETYEIILKMNHLTFEAQRTASGPPGPDGKKKPSNEWLQLDDERNATIARTIPGITFLRARGYKQRNVDQLLVGISTKSDQNPKGLPVNIPPTMKIFEVEYHKDAKELRIPKGAKPIPFDFTGLSPGELTVQSFSEEKGLSGKGVIRPSIPLLRGAELQIAFSGDELRVTAPVPKDKLKSLPGLRITEAALNFELSPEFKPSGDLKFEIGPKQKPFGTGSVSVSADEQGFLAQGDLNARVPGFDEATAHVSYRVATGWQGTAHLKTSKSFVKNAEVNVGLNDQGFDIAGSAKIGLPGDQEVDLGVEKKGDKVLFTGVGVFNVPGDKLDPVKIRFDWDGDHIKGTGDTGFKFKGFTGSIHVTYADGKVSGIGTLDFVKPKAKGKLRLKMSPEQRFSGEGEVTYQFTENLIGTAGIVVDENEKVTLKGALEFPKPIPLFKGFKGDHEIFSIGVSIPIPGASVGPVGLVARIEGALSAGYNIGPGELRNVKLMAMLNPFEDNPNVDVELSAQLYIGASAYVSGSISGAIMLEAYVASVSGGLKLTVTAALDGHFAADASVHYRQSNFVVSGNFEVMLQLLFKLAIDAFVKAQAGIGPFKKETSKTWNLAGYTFDPGLKLGVKSRKPIVYDSQKAFEAPGLDDIEVTKPNLNVQDMMSKIFSAGNKPEETKE